MPEVVAETRGLGSFRRLNDLTDDAQAAKDTASPAGGPVPVRSAQRQRRNLWLPEHIYEAVRDLGWGRGDAVMRALDHHSATVREGRVPAATFGLGPRRTWSVGLRPQAWQRIDRIAEERDWSPSVVIATLLAQMPDLGLRADSDELVAK